jgi:PAS domain S-box-containing protein
MILYLNRLEAGYDWGNVIGTAAEAIIDPGSIETFRTALSATYETGESQEYEVIIVAPDGAEIWYRSQTYPLRRDGQIAAIMLQASNVTELKRAQDEIEELRRLLPICAWCNRIRNDEGSWESLGAYLKREADTDVTHGLCPACLDRQLNELPEQGGAA